MRRFSRALVAAVAVTSCPAIAAANGRFPQTNQIVYDFGGGPDLAARTTFGVLVSHDRGATFHWVCEQVVGYAGNQDPGIGLFGDGSLAVAAFEGLLVSHDGGCSWQKIGNGLENEYVIDVAIQRGAPLRGVAVTSTGMTGGKFHVQAWSTIDGAKTWTPAGVQLPIDLLAETIDVAPSDPQRLYVSGTFVDSGGTKQGAIEVSADGGGSWTRTVVDLGGDQSIFVAGVDPIDPLRVYVRTRGSGKDAADGGVVDRLLVSKDGGGSFQQAAAIGGPMSGFALSPNGARVAIGSVAAGLLVAARDDLAFVSVAKKAIQCLAWSPDGLYACGSDFADGYVIGRTIDEGKTFVPLIPKLADVGGPLATCAAGSAYEAECLPLWPMLGEQYGIGTTGSGGSAGGGASPAGSAAAAGSSGNAMPAAVTPAKGGCGCGAAGSDAGGGAIALLSASFAALFAASRRKRRDTARAPVRE